jgi:SAM-dependent methyltransferase
MTPTIHDEIEILPVSLLDAQRPLVERFKRLANELHMELGWHYLLDLAWIMARLGDVSGKRILDAGAGVGLLQWMLAEQGAEVISVDRGDRATLPLHLRARYQVRGFRPSDLASPARVIGQEIRRPLRLGRQMVEAITASHSRGQVVLYHQDLKTLTCIADSSLDAVVAVSALEHNSPEGLAAVVNELLRVLKPGAPLLATLCAAPSEDTWHAPSSGMCYTDASLRRLFQLDAAAPSNYAQHDELFESLRASTELSNGLARFYARSGENGMPWGKWDPQYQPVGVCKVKTA